MKINKIIRPEIITKQPKGYKLHIEKENADKLKINFLVIDDWVHEKIIQGLNCHEIIELFYQTSIPLKMESFLSNKLEVINDYLKRVNLENIKESIKEFIKSFNNKSLNNYLKNIKFSFTKTFNTGLALDKEIRVPLGQVYRQVFNIKEEVSQEDFNYFLHLNTVHELGHELQNVSINESNHFNPESFAESFAELYCEHKGWDYSLRKSLFLFEKTRLTLGKEVGIVLWYLANSKVSVDKAKEKGLSNILTSCEGRSYSYNNSNINDYLNIIPEQIKELCKK